MDMDHKLIRHSYFLVEVYATFSQIFVKVFGKSKFYVRIPFPFLDAFINIQDVELM